MDALKKLKLEYNGIKDTIEKYTTRGNVINHLNQLEIALNENDIVAIRYCLKELTEWYFNNISAIYANNYVHDKTDHDRNKDLIEKLEIDMRTYELKAITLNKNDRYSEEPFIFLSHKSDDKRYGDALEKLIVGLGVKNKSPVEPKESCANPLGKYSPNQFEHRAHGTNQSAFQNIGKCKSAPRAKYR